MVKLIVEGRSMDLKAEDLLNQEEFEKYIAVNTSIEDLKAIFLASEKDLDRFTRKTYGLDFRTAYNLLLRRALAEYKSCLSGLAQVGNATAINTINQLTLNMSQDVGVRIVVNAEVPKNDEEDGNEQNR